jgi:hypothetical protein
MSGRYQRVMPLICEHGHVWESVVTGVDWAGAIFGDAFCPQCGRKGRRIPFTPDDLGNMVTDDDLKEIGRDAEQVFGFVLMELTKEQLKTREFSVVLHADEIAKGVAEHRSRVLGFLNRLEALDYLKRELTLNELRWRFSLGAKVKLVTL